jgi:hypothetical protein
MTSTCPCPSPPDSPNVSAHVGCSALCSTFGDNQANGTNDVHWVKALVDPHSRDVFAFQAEIVPANRVAVPAP